MMRRRNAKIIATLGPAVDSRDAIAALFKAGADLFRLNFSHGTHEEHRAIYEAIRDVEREVGRPIGVIMDLQGPKLRIGTFANGPVRIRRGDRFRLDSSAEPGESHRVEFPHPEAFAALKAGMDVLLDDGQVRLRCLECGPDHAETEVVIGGVLSDHKGVNLPGLMLGISPLTAKDRRDLAFGLELGVDWVALSFVQEEKDVDEARELIGNRAGVMAKLERRSAIIHLDKIVERADAVMVARGDLGVELPPEEVPAIQKRILRACRKAGKPVVVATQMLNSMILAPTPTRAEASDVATAVYDGADAVMLSQETAAGDYPIEAVEMMNRIICGVRLDPYFRVMVDAARPEPEATDSDAIIAAASKVAETVSAKAIASFTSSGWTSLRAARERPHVPVLGLTPNLKTARRLTLAWGVRPIVIKEQESFDGMVEQGLAAALELGLVSSGDKVVITAGIPLSIRGTTNILRIAKLP
ncbi:MAG: pyruvate kinase [Rhodospirillales bacterium RIFCSPLOWO2_12_FULL_58_28]|nr:MAG: pyruvate kinase [Rhodospirillales bacterium RIFCSPLOWO2_02_FULL_58_16]OHC78276.1 MAG: pyruvate kinase [Rhodospirillales bacterium RIFCSPLOWO2_12_FULL_58_28]